MYRKVYVKLAQLENKQKNTPLQLTENPSAYPQSRSIQAHPTIEIVKAALPSNVFDVEDDHRCFPSRLPTIDAYHHRQPLLDKAQCNNSPMHPRPQR